MNRRRMRGWMKGVSPVRSDPSFPRKRESGEWTFVKRQEATSSS